jgi:hypothetical protein
MGHGHQGHPKLTGIKRYPAYRARSTTGTRVSRSAAIYGFGGGVVAGAVAAGFVAAGLAAAGLAGAVEALAG